MSLSDQAALEARVIEYSGMTETTIRAAMSGWKQHAPGWIGGDIVLQRRRDHALTSSASSSPLLIGRAKDFYSRALSSDTFVLLDFIWNHFRTKGVWPTTWSTHKELGKQSVAAARKELNHAYLIENPSSTGQIYELQILGVLLTAGGGRIQDLLERYLGYLRENYPNSSENEPIPSEQIQRSLGLDPEEIELLGRSLDRLGFGAFGKLQDGSWAAYWSREIEDFPPTMEPSQFLKQFLARRFKHIESSNAHSAQGQVVDIFPTSSSLQTSDNAQSIERTDRLIIEALRGTVPAAARSYEQALRDLNDHARVSYRGPAADMREALRETLDHFAPDDSVTKMTGYKQEPDANGPTMRQKIRYVLSMRGQKKEQYAPVEAAAATVDEIIGTFVRSVYTRSNISTHSTTNRQELLRLRQYVRLSIMEILAIKE